MPHVTWSIHHRWEESGKLTFVVNSILLRKGWSRWRDVQPRPCPALSVPAIVVVPANYCNVTLLRFW